MRINRQRKFDRILNFYSNNFGFRRPYQVLIDGTFCYAALKSKVNIREQLPSYFQGEVKLLTTQCVILETESLGPALYGAMLVVKQFSVHSCGHEQNPLTGAACLESMVDHNNPGRYVLATQDRDLQWVADKIPGVPLLFLNNKAPTLQKPSELSRKVAERAKMQSYNLSRAEKEFLRRLSIATLGSRPRPIIKKKKRKKKGGPNPLSCLKKKKKNQNYPGQQQASQSYQPSTSG